MSTHYIVIDIQTQEQVGKPYNSDRRARARANKLDSVVGGCRYVVRTIQGTN